MRRLCKLLTWTAATVLTLPAWAAESMPTQPLSPAASQVLDWVVRARDHEDLPFMIIDKRRAHLWVFDRSGQPRGNAPILLGSARGDHTVAGVGELKLAEIKPEDRTTPAGRFRADVGRNLRGEEVIWVDYDAGVSMHPVLTTNAAERREQRLSTPTADDNRVSYGCINVPKAFYEQTVLGTVRGASPRGYSIVYILPESLPLGSVFRQLAATPASAVAVRQ